MSTLGSTWGAYVVIGCLGESELLLGGDMQECQVYGSDLWPHRLTGTL